jgi:hypothetical protein
MAKRPGNMPLRMPALPAFPPDVLAAVNTMDHQALTRRPVPDYHAALGAERIADAVLAALWRRGMLT